MYWIILPFFNGKDYPIHRFFGLSRKKYNIFKQFVKKIREITEVEHKIGKTAKACQCNGGLAQSSLYKRKNAEDNFVKFLSQSGHSGALGIYKLVDSQTQM
jgi:hypothetical protein